MEWNKWGTVMLHWMGEKEEILGKEKENDHRSWRVLQQLPCMCMCVMCPMCIVFLSSDVFLLTTLVCLCCVHCWLSFSRLTWFPNITCDDVTQCVFPPLTHSTPPVISGLFLMFWCSDVVIWSGHKAWEGNDWVNSLYNFNLKIRWFPGFFKTSAQLLKDCVVKSNERDNGSWCFLSF